jgi:small-conductance mechanosensitive channel
MDRLFDGEAISSLLVAAEAWLYADVLVWTNLIQAVTVVATWGLAWPAARALRRFFAAAAAHRWVHGRVASFVHASTPLALPLAWLALTWIAVLVAAAAGWPHRVLEIAVSLLSAWIVIRYAAMLVSEPTWQRLLAIAAWSVAALNILGLLGPTVDLLDSLAVTLGGSRFSLLTVLKGMLALALLLWGAVSLSSLLERRITAAHMLTPSVQVLFSKLLKVTLITLAIVAAVGSVGIDLTGFAVFTGALGVGIGFGLQKVVSNLISGVILLLDRSVKPGDVIAVGSTYGWVNSMGARYVSLVTRDGIEYLIPNEDLITQRVENWSYSNDLIRLHCAIGVSYKSDVKKAMALAVEAAAAAPRVMSTPQPICLLVGFGDSSVDIELRFWIRDPQNGTSNVRSDILLGVWDRFHEHGIEIPFPQRDLHLKSAEGVRITAAE